MTSIVFTVRPSAAFHGKLLEMVPVLDGIELTQLVTDYEAARAFDVVDGYSGIVPGVFRYGSLIEYYLGSPEDEYWIKEGKVALLGCECGEVGCWPLYAHVHATESSVVWRDFAQPFRPSRDYGGFGPFTFDRGDYERAVKDAIRLLAENVE